MSDCVRRVKIIKQVEDERWRQIEELDHRCADDDRLTRGELLTKAATLMGVSPPKRAKGYSRADLVKAAALLIAEIERLDRAIARSQTPTQRKETPCPPAT